MSACIKVDGLKKYYGDVKAVDGISFEVEQGTIFGMLGRNGAGKTTTIETLIGLTDRTGGHIEVLGLDPAQDLEELKERIGVQLQSPVLFSHLTVKETLDLFASFYENPIEPEEVIEMLGLKDKENSIMDSLSGGQFHRVAVALAIISNGDIIFLDEPTTGLDPQARRKVWDTIARLKEKGKTIFLTTHFMDEAEILCDSLVIIDTGKLIAEGSPEDLINQYFAEQTIEFVNSNLDQGLLQGYENLNGVLQLEHYKNKNLVKLHTDDASTTIKELIDFSCKTGNTIEKLQLRKPGLEDLFLKLTGSEIKDEEF